MIKNILRFTIVLTLLIQSLSPSFAAEEPQVISPAFVVMDANTGAVLYGKNINQKVYPASTTKIMTILLALKYGNIQNMATVSDFDVYSLEEGASNIALEPGEQIKIEDALYAAGIPSANDACNTIATAVGGNYDKFIEMMNTEAMSAGAIGTHFANPHGLHNDDHYTTPYDLAMIMKAGLAVDGFTTYLSQTSYEFPATNMNDVRYFYSHNQALLEDSDYYIEGIQATKTGYTDEAQCTLISYVKHNDKDLIVAVFDLPDSISYYTDTIALLNYIDDHYDYFNTNTVRIEIPEVDLPIHYHFKSRHFYTTTPPATLLAHTNTNQYPITASIQFNQLNETSTIDSVIGQLEYKQNGQTLFTTAVYLNTTIYHFDFTDLLFWVLLIVLSIIIILVITAFLLRYYIRRKRRLTRAYKRSYE